MILFEMYNLTSVICHSCKIYNVLFQLSHHYIVYVFYLSLHQTNAQRQNHLFYINSTPFSEMEGLSFIIIVNQHRRSASRLLAEQLSLRCIVDYLWAFTIANVFPKCITQCALSKVHKIRKHTLNN